jgi:cytochrome bd-type quinol oxidase subunit 2
MSADRPRRPDRTRDWGRALAAAYAFMALAACARSGVQIATKLDAAPLAFTLSAASGAIYLVAAFALRRDGERSRRLAAVCCSVELLGVLAVGAWSLLDPALFPEPTVWSGFGSGYACIPLALPLLGLAYLKRTRPSPGRRDENRSHRWVFGPSARG